MEAKGRQCVKNSKIHYQTHSNIQSAAVTLQPEEKHKHINNADKIKTQPENIVLSISTDTQFTQMPTTQTSQKTISTTKVVSISLKF